jgi:hypothetical protein
MKPRRLEPRRSESSQVLNSQRMESSNNQQPRNWVGTKHKSHSTRSSNIRSELSELKARGTRSPTIGCELTKEFGSSLSGPCCSGPCCYLSRSRETIGSRAIRTNLEEPDHEWRENTHRIENKEQFKVRQSPNGAGCSSSPGGG